MLAEPPVSVLRVGMLDDCRQIGLDW